MADNVTDWVVLGCYVACIYLLVRPSSKAIPAVKGYFDGMARLASIATDIG
jgi:hypothetical protein